MRQLTIAGRRIADDTDAYNVAELGHNHGGSLLTAEAMIRAAAAAGADAVKLQKRSNHELYTQEAYDRPYTSENSFGATYGEHREALEFDFAQYVELAWTSETQHVAFMVTAFDIPSADLLERLAMATEAVDGDQLAAIKIASNDVINLPLLKHVAGFGKPIILSTGAATQEDVDRAVNTIYPINPQLALLQCSAIYPAPAELLNLRVITTYRERYPDLVIGLSSHFAHPYDVLIGYALGARIFEKHFCLDRTAKGTDQAFSLEPDGFKGMVAHLKAARLMMGDGLKACLPEELPAIEKMRKSTNWWAEQYGEVKA